MVFKAKTSDFKTVHCMIPIAIKILYTYREDMEEQTITC